MGEGRRREPQLFLVYEGRHLKAEFYFDAGGHIPGYSFYGSRSEEEKRRFFHIVEYLCDRPRGEPLPTTMFNLEEAANKIYAVKPYSGRYLGFFAKESRFVITNGFPKQTGKLGRRERRHVRVAIERKQDYLERVNRGEYYEKE